jgi:hypothetical protein
VEQGRCPVTSEKASSYPYRKDQNVEGIPPFTMFLQRYKLFVVLAYVSTITQRPTLTSPVNTRRMGGVPLHACFRDRYRAMLSLDNVSAVSKNSNTWLDSCSGAVNDKPCMKGGLALLVRSA